MSETMWLLPSLSIGGVRRRPVDAGQTPQQSGGDDGNGPDQLNVHADRRTDSRPAEDECRSVRLVRHDHVTSDLHQLR